MPRRFTAEQYAASKALGELRTQKSFAGDTEAWRRYQDECYRTLRPGEALPPVKRSSRRRPHLWKAAVRQRKTVEAQRTKVAADADADHKLMVSTCWLLKNLPSVSNVQLGPPRPSAESEGQVLRQLTATVKTPDGTNTLVEEVRYDLQDLDRFPDSFKNIAKRNRHREQLALQRLAARGRGQGSGYCAAFSGFCGYV